MNESNEYLEEENRMKKSRRIGCWLVSCDEATVFVEDVLNNRPPLGMTNHGNANVALQSGKVLSYKIGSSHEKPLSEYLGLTKPAKGGEPRPNSSFRSAL